MTFDWQEYLTLSELLGDMDNEAAQRSALSRAYYSAYCTTRNWPLSHGYVLMSRRQVHQVIWNEMIFQTDPGVWSGFDEVAAKLARSLGNDGHRLREIRELADYEDQYTDLLLDLRTEIARAARIHEGLRRL